MCFIRYDALQRPINGVTQTIKAHRQVWGHQLHWPDMFYRRWNVMFHSVSINKNAITPKHITDGISLSLPDGLKRHAITAAQCLEQGVIVLQPQHGFEVCQCIFSSCAISGLSVVIRFRRGDGMGQVAPVFLRDFLSENAGKRLDEIIPDLGNMFEA